ncbi:MAG: rhomboid family intramembrane serine protease [Bdellovibrionales bacterium]
MIVPILNGLLRFYKAPITWIIFFLNGAVFLGSIVPSVESQTTIDHYLDNEHFLRLQGRLFAQYIQQNPEDYTDLMQNLAARGLKGSTEKLQLLGSLAVRNSQFMSEAPNLEFRGDQVEIKRWRRDIKQLQNSQDRHPSYVLGLTADDVSVGKWLSYIFVHSGTYHFIGNMYFLLIFGSMLEPIIGGLAVLVVFLLSGMVAAGVFILLTGATAAPLIGASGAVSGLMALFCFYFWRRPVRFFYFLLPSIRYVGVIFLPAWVVLIMFVLSDLAGYWGSVGDFGGVAYTAHLGGEAAALLIGSIVYLLRYRNGPALAPVHVEKMGHPISMHDMVEAMRNRPRRHPR